ncbi:N-terminal acetyltransferase [Tulasnella sp. JGI-2019a]|nr:N-terminal acetyltransferase [Tulasnella sp. JGI-2019a]KAG9002744.1 N-terminal acetyltransferase [Tulasnella sp. JGI-2019a]KAG9027341.1 N-terminal acetyltransferase [Tulasnella sp. JGI-2019a]
MLQMNATPSYYTDGQLAAYLKHIGLPSAINDKPSLDNVETIIQHHLTTIPFDNTEMHYTKRGEVESDPQAVYTRIIEEKKGGSICYGLHLLILGMLLKLGYRGYNIMARMNRTGGDPSFLNLTVLEHQSILIQIPGDNGTYFIDISIGLGFTRPAPLKVDCEFDGLAPQKYRFSRTHHPDSPLSGIENAEWRLETNLDLKAQPIFDPGWIAFMQFSTQPFFLKDIAIFNGLAHTRPDSVLPKAVVAMIFTGGRNGEPLTSKTVVKDNLLSRKAGCAMEVRKLESEEERIAVLEESFGITYPADSKECITGRMSAIGVAKEKSSSGPGYFPRLS